MEHNQFWKHDELVRRERKSWVHIVGRAPQIAGAAAIPTTSSNPFLPTSKTTTIRPSRAAKTTAAAATSAVATATSDTAKVTRTTSTVATSATVATSSATRLASTKPARITTSTTESSAASASSSSSGTAVDASASSKAKSGTSTGTVVAIVIVVIVLAGLIGAFFGWRKYKANRAARGSGAGLVAGGGSFRRHKEEDDDVFGNQSAGGGYGSNAEKNYGGTGGYGALGINPQHAYQPQADQGGAAAFAGDASTGAGMAGMGARGQQQQQQGRQSWDTPSSGFGTPPPSSYPPSSSGSTTHLISEQQYGDNQPAYVPMPTVVETPPPAVKSPFGDAPGEGKIYIVRNTFVPSQPDELVVYPDDRIQVLIAYDDGWALGINLDAADKTPKKGVFPFDCVTEIAPSPNAHQVELSATAPASSQFPSPSQSSQTLPYPQQQSSPPDQSRQLTPLPPVAQSSGSGFPDYSQSAPQMGPPQLAPLRSDSPLFAPHQMSGSPARSSLALPSSLQVGNRDGDKGKRTSSLIASRDAELFLALGNQFDQQDQQRTA